MKIVLLILLGIVTLFVILGLIAKFASVKVVDVNTGEEYTIKGDEIKKNDVDSSKA